MSIDWQKEIDKEWVNNRKELIELLYARLGSQNKIAEYLGIHRVSLQSVIKEDNPDIGYYFCIECGEKVYRKSGQGRKKTCDKSACQKILSQKLSVNQRKITKRRREKLNKLKGNFKKDELNQKKRVCRGCGCDPSPNYFYCNDCRNAVLNQNSGGLDEAYGAVF